MTARADGLTGQVKKAVEKITLDQPGTKPFHLKAEYVPSFRHIVTYSRCALSKGAYATVHFSDKPTIQPELMSRGTQIADFLLDCHFPAVKSRTAAERHHQTDPPGRHFEN
jgi:hypothetical protein